MEIGDRRAEPEWVYISAGQAAPSASELETMGCQPKPTGWSPSSWETSFVARGSDQKRRRIGGFDALDPSNARGAFRVWFSRELSFSASCELNEISDERQGLSRAPSFHRVCGA